MRFFDFDNPVIAGIYKFCYLVLLSVLWLVFCIPVFTAGASTAALYYTVRKNIRNERGTVWGCFWGSFKDNFKQAVPVNLIFLALLLIFMADISILDLLAGKSEVCGYLRVVFWMLAAALCVYAFWVFAYMARFRCPVKLLLKNAMLITVVHFPTSGLIALTGAFSVFMMWLLEPLILILPAGSVFVMSSFTEKVFHRYMSDEDDTVE